MSTKVSYYFFFFSSRRRHTRCSRDWSSDVCSSDLKQEIRERVWALLTARRVARFPLPLADRIPNFAGAERAAERLAETPEWKAATRLKCKPDAAQRPVRFRALREGKLVFVAVPRLREERCFLRLDPAKLGHRVAEAATIAGAARLGAPVPPESLGATDLVIVGSLAGSPGGARGR